MSCRNWNCKNSVKKVIFLEAQSDSFKDGVRKLSELLKVAEHPDHLVRFEACCKVIKNRLQPAMVKNPDQHLPKGELQSVI